MWKIYDIKCHSSVQAAVTLQQSPLACTAQLCRHCGSFADVCVSVCVYTAHCMYCCVCTCLCPAYTWSRVCDYACLSRSSLTVAVSVWPVTLRPVQVSARTRTTVTGCSRTSWLSLSSLPLSSPSGGHRATCFSSGQI